MPRSVVRLPAAVRGDFDVYLNGVAQVRDRDYAVEGRVLVFPRAMRRDDVSAWRWAVGALGVGTYRQDDAVDIRYVRDGRTTVASHLPIEAEPSA